MRWTRALVGGLGLATIAAVAIHVPYFVRGSQGGCPFGYTKVAASGPVHHDPQLRGSAVARQRPALAFALGATSRADVAAYAAAHGGGACRDQHGELECANLAITGGPTLTTAWFAFDQHGVLDSMRTVRRDRAVAPISTTFANLERELTASAGEPAMTSGSFDPIDLARGPLRQAAVEYRFTNYRAVVRATNMGDGYALTEEYANLVD